MTKAQERVAIAKDAIRQINAGRYYVETGGWCSIDRTDTINQELLTRRDRPVCNVCALGAAMASSLRLFNIGQIGSGEASTWDVDQQLSRFFSPNQMTLIEAAFECRGTGLGAFGGNVSDAQIVATARLGILEDKSRALNIFRNIIKNGGTFIP